MKAAREYTDLVETVRWIDVNASGMALPSDERSLIAIGCFDLTLEHQAAIACLHASDLAGSMLALVRILVEALIRGLWLSTCATDLELERFKAGKLDKTFAAMIDQFESTDGFTSTVLSQFKNRAWKALNGFTHTGF